MFVEQKGLTYLLSNVTVWVSALTVERAERATVRTGRMRQKLGTMAIRVLVVDERKVSYEVCDRRNEREGPG